MARNIRALTTSESIYFKENYEFELKDEYIIVTTKNFSRKTLHDVNKPFSISSKVRRINISKEAIDLWINKFKDKYSLVEIQNAMNTLVVTYQDLTLNEITEQLKRCRAKMDNSL